MTLTERVAAAEWTADDAAWFALQSEVAIADQACHDLLMAVAAAVIGADGADILTLRRRAREIVDLALAFQDEGPAPLPVRAAGRPALNVVGGRDA